MMDRKRLRKKADLESSIRTPTIVLLDNEIDTWLEKTARRAYELASSDKDWDYAESPRDRVKLALVYAESSIEKIAERLDEIGCFSVLVVRSNQYVAPNVLTGEMPVSEFLEYLASELENRLSNMIGDDIGRTYTDEYDEDYFEDFSEDDDDDEF
jgi:tetrahydromethanopterin S-methyltransferase subunit G